jgi:hypothetical protein
VRVDVTAMAFEIRPTVFWDVTPCKLLAECQSFEGTCYLHLQDCKKVKAAGSSEILVHTYQIIWHHSPEKLIFT